VASFSLFFFFELNIIVKRRLLIWCNPGLRVWSLSSGPAADSVLGTTSDGVAFFLALFSKRGHVFFFPFTFLARTGPEVEVGSCILPISGCAVSGAHGPFPPVVS